MKTISRMMMTIVLLVMALTASAQETKNKIKEFADNNKVNCYVLENLNEAVSKAYEISESGDTVLLSPACASWDQFKTFEERGELFKK